MRLGMAPYVVQQYKYMKVLETRQIYLRMVASFVKTSEARGKRGMGEWLIRN
jgi:hypothetical protein